MSMQDKVQELLACIETEATRLRSDEGKVDLPDPAEVSATVAYMLAMVIALAQSVELLHAERNRMTALLDGHIARVDALVKQVEVLEENTFNDDLRSEIIREASRAARDEIDWDLSDKAEGYELRELESRIQDLESNLSDLESTLSNIEGQVESRSEG